MYMCELCSALAYCLYSFTQKPDFTVYRENIQIRWFCFEHVVLCVLLCIKLTLKHLNI